MLNRGAWQQVKRLWDALGRVPWQMDGAADVKGFNAQLPRFCSKQTPFDARVIAGHSVYVNPPFHKIEEFVQQYVAAKALNPATEACFITPHKPEQPWFKLLRAHMCLKHTFARNWGADQDRLFSRPLVQGGVAREVVRGNPWPVCVWFSPRVSHTHTESVSQPVRIGSWQEPVVALLSGPALEAVCEVSCTLMGDRCRVLFDDGAATNLVSRKLVQALGLQMTNKA